MLRMNPESNGKLHVGCVIAICLGVALCVASACCFIISQRASRRLEAARDARPVWMEVDLSRRDVYHAPFEQTFLGSHSQELFLQLPPEALRSEAAQDVLESLNARVVIKDAHGLEVLSENLANITVPASSSDGQIRLTYLPTFPKGSYVLELTIAEGVVALDGIPQHVGAKYVFCGLETLAAAIPFLIAIGMLVLAAAIFLVLLIMSRLRKRRRAS